MKKYGLSLLLVSLIFVLSAGIAWAVPGTVEGEGTHFEIIDSEYMNITVDTTVSVNMYLKSVPEWIFYNITPVSTDMSTTLTIGGLAAGTTYYLYENGGNIYTEITADAAGQVSYVHDLSAPHIGYIFEMPQDMTPPKLPGGVEDEGTHFAVTDSDYLNVTVDSVEPVRVRLSSITNTVTMDIAPITAATSTQLTIGSLLPGTTYYKYEDDLHNGVAITTDATGSYTYTQDLTTPHHVMIFTHHSTKFIKDDATGGDCTLIGMWDAATKTCTLATDLTETVQIDDDGITLDGNGHSITGSGTGYGVYGVTRSWLTIKNLHISGFSMGIYLYNSAPGGRWWAPYAMLNNTITDNTITDASFGVYVGYSCSDTTVANNIMTDLVYTGITVYWGGPTIVENNYIDGSEKSNAARFAFMHVTVRNNFFANAMYDGISGVATGGDISYNTFLGNGQGSSFSYYSGIGFYDNNYINNDRQAVEGAWSGYDRNYWSDYDTPAEGCYDNNVDGYCDVRRGIENWQGTIVKYDNHPRTQPVSSAYPNLLLPPVADAGPDRTVECMDPNATPVMLDGSGSYDPNGDPLTYVWTPFDPPATGVTKEVILSYGSNSTFSLTVDDGSSGSDTDTVSITVDNTLPPATTAELAGTMGDNGWFVSDVTVTLQATDSCGGVAELHYSIDGVDQPVVYGSTATFTITEDGEHTVSYWAVDNYGLAAQVVTTQINKETVVPVTTATLSGTPGELNGEPTGYYTSCVGVVLTPSSVSGATTVEYSQDGGQTWYLYTVPLDICIEGLTTWLYRTRSAAGHLEAANTLNLYVDLTPPTTTHEIIAGTMGDNNWYVSDVTIKLTSVDATSGVAELHYKIDGVEQPVVYGGTNVSPLETTFTITADGAHTVTYWAIDDAGKAGHEATTSLSIESSPPVTEPVVPQPPPPPPSDPTTPPPPGESPPPPPPYYPSCVTVQLVTSSSSGVLHTEYSDDNGLTWHTYDGSFEICGDGATVITYRSTSTAGNVEPEKSFEINIDRTNPLITASASPAANTSGWHNSAVVVSFNCTDAMSGIASCTAPVTVTAEGTGQVVTGTAVDMASNSATTSITLDIDRTAPAISASVTPAPDANGWHTGSVVVSFDCSDALSGLASCTAPITVIAEGAGQVVTGTAVDVAGNTAAATVTLNIDTTPPTLNLPADMVAEASSVAGAVVNFTVTATDGADPAPTVICTPASGSVFEPGTTMVNCTATDEAGHSSNGSFNVTVLDATPPVLHLPAGIVVEATGPAGAVVTFTVTATDNFDPNPAVTCTPASGSVFGLGTTTVNCTATDAATNSATGSFTVTVQDTTPPEIYLPADIVEEATGVEGAVVAFTVTATDIADPNPAVTCTPASGSVFAIDTTTVNCTATDAATNSASGSFSVAVQDTTPPVLTCPADISVLLNTPPTDPAVTAFLNGAIATDLVDQSVDITNDAPSSYGTPDPMTVTFTATDDYLNSSTCSAEISVVYNFGGFLTPITLDRPFKSGSTIPVKFQLTEYGGNYVSTAHAEISVVQLSGTEPMGDPIDGTTNVPDSSNVFRYVSTDNHYIYNLSTDGISVGEWHVLVTLDDGATYTVNIGLK